MRNPFTIGNMIQNPEQFVGRTAELHHIINRLGKLESCSVVGERRIGKSSLLNHLSQTRVTRLGDKSFQFLYIELTDASTQTIVDFLRTILEALNCSTDGIKDENKPNRNLMAFDHEVKALADCGQNIVLCLDEFEGLFENAAEFNNAFFNHFRTMVNHRRLALVTASRKTLETYGNEKKLTSPFFNLLSVTELGDFTEEEAVQFLA
ncbi:MAG: ATP-binding protein, partial [Acidobacteriota bacterium]